MSADVVRLKDFAKNPEHAWNELRPRIVQRALTTRDFTEIMQSPLLVAATLVDRQSIEIGDKLYGEHSTHHYRSYQLVYRDAVTGKLEQRRCDNVDDDLARRVFEQRLDLIQHDDTHFNIDLVSRISQHREQAVIALRFEDGAFADERIIIPGSNHNLLRFYLTQLGYGFDGSQITKRPDVAPRRKTKAEEYADRVNQRHQDYKCEW